MNINNILDECSEIQELAEGGQKQVFKAKHPKHGLVAVKIGKYNYDTSLERINREVGFLKSIRSKYYPRNYDYIIDDKDKSFLIIEEFIDGPPLAEVKKGFNSEGKIIALFIELLNGLSILWNSNGVHRDLKPSNILIIENSQPVIIDLGIARFLDMTSLTKTMAGRGPCTPIYASPEQLLNKKHLINLRSDIFSLGIILLELHLGFHPFDGNNIGNNLPITENIIAGSYSQPNRKKTSQEFCFLIRKMLKLQPFERFRNYHSIRLFIERKWGQK